MYFETIHNVEQFDEVQEEDDAYSTYLESDDDLDDVTLGNLLFAHVSGDSASVLCLEQVSDVLTMREREKKSSIQAGRPTVSLDSQGQVNGDEREYAGRALECRVSHHSGSDGMYDQPEEGAFAPEDTNTAAEHIYESLDDCGEQYVLYIAKGSDGSGHSGDTLGHAGGTSAKPSSDVSDRSDCSGGKPKLPKQNSLPGSREQGSEDHERRKSEGDILRRKKRCTEKSDDSVAPKLPPNRPTRVSRGSGEPADCAAIPATSVERRNSSKKLGAQVSQATPQPLVIKHKGKTYLIPVVEAKETKAEKAGKHQQLKRQSRLNPNSLSRQTISVAVPPQMVVAGVTLRPMSHSESTAFSTCAYQSTTLPISVKTSDQPSPHRRKSSKQSVLCVPPQHTSTQMQQVTHYGVL